MIALQTSTTAAMPRRDEAATAQRHRLAHFLTSIERRALRMAEFASGNLDDALELVQESMLGFVKSYADKPEAEWPPLFFRILDSRIQDHHRRQSVRGRWRVFFRRDDDAEDPMTAVSDTVTASPLDQLRGSEAAHAINGALQQLPDRQRQAFLLRIWEGFDVAATAAVMGCSEGSVKTHLFRAMEALRQRLEAHR